MTKSHYVRRLLEGRIYDPRLVDAVLIYWHSAIPFEEAEDYIHNFNLKIKNLHDEPANPRSNN